MASIEKRTAPNGNVRWLARYRAPNGTDKAPSFATRAQAKNFLTTVENDKLAGTYVDPRLGDITIEQWGEMWFARQSYDRQESARRVHNALRVLYRAMGDKPLRGVFPSHMESWVKAMKRQYAPNTVSNTWGWARVIFTAAVRDRRIPYSPCDGVKLHLARTPDIVVPTVEEVLAVQPHLPERWRDLALVGAKTGLRPSELLGVCREQFHLLAREPFVKVDRQLQTGRVVPYTKTENSFGRQVPLDPGTVAILNAHLGKYDIAPEGRLFPVNNPRRTWSRATAKAGIKRQMRMHDLRHFYASEMYAETLDWQLVADRLGDTVTTTMRTYTHLVARSEDRARGAMDRVFARSRVQGVY